jgi:hypothetical protein
MAAGILRRADFTLSLFLTCTRLSICAIGLELSRARHAAFLLALFVCGIACGSMTSNSRLPLFVSRRVRTGRMRGDGPFHARLNCELPQPQPDDRPVRYNPTPGKCGSHNFIYGTRIRRVRRPTNNIRILMTQRSGTRQCLYVLLSYRSGFFVCGYSGCSPYASRCLEAQFEPR